MILTDFHCGQVQRKSFSFPGLPFLPDDENEWPHYDFRPCGTSDISWVLAARCFGKGDSAYVLTIRAAFPR